MKTIYSVVWKKGKPYLVDNNIVQTPEKTIQDAILKMNLQAKQNDQGS